MRTIRKQLKYTLKPLLSVISSDHEIISRDLKIVAHNCDTIIVYNCNMNYYLASRNLNVFINRYVNVSCHSLHMLTCVFQMYFFWITNHGNNGNNHIIIKTHLFTFF